MPKSYQKGFLTPPKVGKSEHTTHKSKKKDDCYWIEDLCEMWNMTSSGVRKRLKRCKIPHHKESPRKIYVLIEEYQDFLKRCPASWEELPGVVYV